ncbi:5-oxoprolinase [[Candida] jaroonii]|uniref:5-oxoprolinase n=1 Tax=[Candida] jaroonii TaxID=467808 RepID=A0ACA9YET8_9ASCO|nr:5-oxoprolinase [[Candida] jaroonii]
MTVSDVKIAIDRGGTFTDVLAIIPGQSDYMFKLLSVDPANYKDATIEGIRRVLEKVTGARIPKGQPLDTTCVSSIRMGTTVATNALLERKGVRSAFLVTRGFKDILHIGDQTRPDLFALVVDKPSPLYEEVVEIGERVTIPSATEDPESLNYHDKVDGEKLVHGESKDVFQILKPLDKDDARKKLLELKVKGIDSIGICLIHGYSYQAHEQQLKEIAEEVGFSNISVSHELIPMISAIPRSQSTVVDAYLTPIVKEYINNFLSGLKGSDTRIEFMQSDGGLCSWDKFTGLKALLSGPAGGVVGEAETCYDANEKTPIVGFDMGGTSTDVSRYAGSYEHVFKSITAGVQIAAPQLDINTVAAGGGSILTYQHGVFKVGPDSAGAHPGPACYRKGGPLTITDANLMCGRILPQYFPQIFGPNENEPLDTDIVEKKFQELAETINKDGSKYTAFEVALGFLKVANFQMAKPIRVLTESRGFDVSQHNLASFGGAGGQHATSIASILKMRRVLIHRYSSILSAYGIALADIVQEDQKPCHEVYGDKTRDELLDKCKSLVTNVKQQLLAQGVNENTIEAEIFFNMGYDGSDTFLMIPQPEDNDFHRVFTEVHKRQFSFVDKNRGVVVHDIRVRASGNVSKIKEVSPFDDLAKIEKFSTAKPITTSKIHFEEGLLDSRIYELSNLPVGSVVKGPSLILDATQTILVTPSSTATILSRHVVIDLEKSKGEKVMEDSIDPILLSVFANRFTAIAEDMGRTLQKISISPNIKERMDFSCALFDADGDLVANAPHVPVHLGSMSNSIRYAKKFWEGNIHEGDILATNHPIAGGTHLPDITLISPVFKDGEIVFFTASRAHHAEIGGSVPGSCAADATSLYEEGAQFVAWKIVSKGEFDHAGVQKYFVDEPASYPGCSGTRRLKDNVSDLNAQIASNQRGVNLLMELFNEYGTEVVLRYMKGVEATAEVAVRKFLKQIYHERKEQLPLTAEEIMDDGSLIKVSIDIKADGSATYDFTGTSEEAFNCGNAPIAITYACIIYCLRLMVNSDIPLNEGCLNPVTPIIPKGSILNPSPFAAVSAANSATAQRLTDTILKAYQVCGASSGSNNTLAFGKGGITNGVMKPGFAMVETIGGGIGAVEGSDGFSGVHCHMTNTKITDPEVLELRYPIVLHEFSVRHRSGGDGAYKGGDGLVRIYEFTTPLSCTLRTQRRVNAPFGIKGGKEAKRGENRLGRKRGDEVQWILLPSFAQFKVEAGDFVKIRTPGGGGYGEPTDIKPGITKTSTHIPLAGGTVASMNDLGITSQ